MDRKLLPILNFLKFELDKAPKKITQGLSYKFKPFSTLDIK